MTIQGGAKRIAPLMTVMAAAIACIAAPNAGRAEVSEVRIVRQFGIHYLPLVIMEHEQLVEKQAKAAGLPDIKVTWARLSGGASVNDALLAKSVDFSAGGVGPLLVLWDRSKNGKGDVKAAAAVSEVPMTLTTRDPKIKSIADFTDKDRIALPAVKTSMQAVTLQMAAAKQWGKKDFERLDPLTMSLPHPDATAAIISGAGEITSHFTAAPYDFMQLKQPGIHAVLDSYDVYGGPASLILLYATTSFYDENPKVYQGVVKAMGDAMDLIRTDKKRAAEIYLAVTKEKTTVEDLVSMLKNPKINFKLAPSATFPVAEFMFDIGRVKTKAASWKDYFFPSAHDLSGS
jgi:NitT/TauT family transport system substrate-binding protein